MFYRDTRIASFCLIRLLRGSRANSSDIANVHKPYLKSLRLNCYSISPFTSQLGFSDFLTENDPSCSCHGKGFKCSSRTCPNCCSHPQVQILHKKRWIFWPASTGAFVRRFSTQLSSREWIEELQAERGSNCEYRVLLAGMVFGQTIPVADTNNPNNKPFSDDSSPVENISENTSVLVDSLPKRLESAKRGSSVLPVIFSWLDEGNTFCRNTLAEAVDRLIELVRYRDALEVCEWMIGVEPNKVELTDYLRCLGLIAKVRGHSKAAKFFAYLPRDYAKSELAYLTMFANYVDQKALYRAKILMKKMKEMGFIKSPFVYNQILNLFKDKGKEDRIPDLLKDMKAAGILPDINTYNIMLEVKSKGGDIAGMERLFVRMKESDHVKPNVTTFSILALAYISAGLIDKAHAFTSEIKNQKGFDKMGVSHDLLITLYEKLGDVKALESFWELLQSSHLNRSTYVCVIRAFGKLGEIKKAEEAFRKMQEIGLLKPDQYNSMIDVYASQGLLQKAEELHDEMIKMGCQPNGRSYHYLISGYLKHNKTEKALQTLRVLQENFAHAGSFSACDTLVLIMRSLAEKGDVKNAEDVFQDIKREKRGVDVCLYNILLEAYVHAGMHAYRFLQRMAADKVSPNEKTTMLLDKLKRISSH